MSPMVTHKMAINLCQHLYKLGLVTDDTFDTVHNLFEQQISNEKLIGSDNLMWKFIYLYPGKFDVV